MHHDQHPQSPAHAKEKKSILIFRRMHRIGNQETIGIREDATRLVEADSMLLSIARILACIPLESHTSYIHSSQQDYKYVMASRHSEKGGHLSLAT